MLIRLQVYAQDVLKPVDMQVQSFPFKEVSYDKVEAHKDSVIATLKLKYADIDSAILVKNGKVVSLFVHKELTWLSSGSKLKIDGHSFSLRENTGPLNKSELVITEHDKQTLNDVFWLVNVSSDYIMFIKDMHNLVLTTTGW